MNNQFFIVGAQRSGTTYLYTILDEHPEICMAKPVKPEPKYFLNKNINLDEYKNFYKDCNAKIYGEKSTSYYENKGVAQKIYRYFPNAKIIFILANPVDRAISNYKFSYENGLETRTLKEVFIDNKPIDNKYNTSVNPFLYKERGIYYKFLEYYFNIFPKKNIKVLIREKFVSNLDEIKNLYRFLNVDDSFIPISYDKIINSSQLNVGEYGLQQVKKELKLFYKQYNQKLKSFNVDITEWI